MDHVEPFRSLVVYCSRTGRTRVVARAIAAELDSLVEPIAGR